MISYRNLVRLSKWPTPSHTPVPYFSGYSNPPQNYQSPPSSQPQPQPPQHNHNPYPSYTQQPNFTPEYHQRYRESLSSTPDFAQISNDRSKPLYVQSVGRTPGSSPDHPIYIEKERGKTLLDLIFRLLPMGFFFYIAYQIINFKDGQGPLAKIRGTVGGESENIDVTFDDVVGCDEVLSELIRVVDFLQDRPKYQRLGAKLPKGILLSGPPGVGKTLLARACAGEAGVPFYFCSASEFDEVFVGLGASRVRSLFSKAKENAPCILFIDEIDALGNRSNSKFRSGPNQTLNQFLSEIDGFENNSGVILIAATNLAEDLDPALTRPGRFDKTVYVHHPTYTGRIDLFKFFLSKTAHNIPMTQIERLSAITEGLTGAGIENIVNQACLAAAEDKEKNALEFWDLKEAFENIFLGPRRLNELPEKTKQVTAFHEAGHALVSLKSPGAKPLLKATIVPRGSALGMVVSVPEPDTFLKSKTELLTDITVAMGGRAAEKIIFGEDNITTGAGNDFKQAQRIASSMVKEMGMSEIVGNRSLSSDDYNNLSSDMKEIVDREIKKLVDEGQRKAEHILTTYSKQHRALAEALLLHETLTSEEVEAIVDGNQLDPKLTEEALNARIRSSSAQYQDLQSRLQNLRKNRMKRTPKKPGSAVAPKISNPHSPPRNPPQPTKSSEPTSNQRNTTQSQSPSNQTRKPTDFWGGNGRNNKNQPNQD